jgi:hypothetical protein
MPHKLLLCTITSNAEKFNIQKGSNETKYFPPVLDNIRTKIINKEKKFA